MGTAWEDTLPGEANLREIARGIGNAQVVDYPNLIWAVRDISNN